MGERHKKSLLMVLGYRCLRSAQWAAHEKMNREKEQKERDGVLAIQTQGAVWVMTQR